MIAKSRSNAQSQTGLATRTATLPSVESVRERLAEVASVEAVKDVADKYESYRLYFKKAGDSLELQNQAAEIRLWAIRRAGELLASMPKHNGDPLSHEVTGARTLSEIGIERMQSSRWQRIASLQEEVFQKYIEQCKEDGKELTASGALKLVKKESNATEAADPISHGIVTSLDTLVAAGAKFSTIYADPPWQYDNKATRSAVDGIYKSTMSLDEICAEPVSQIVADDAHLHLWTTNGFLFDAKRVMEAWGFTYKSCFVWAKTQMGIGNYWRVSHEFMLFGIRGKLPFANRGQRSWQEYPRTKHSRKPADVRRRIELVSPGPYLEMYGREHFNAPWTVYGNEVASGGLFDDRE